MADLARPRGRDDHARGTTAHVPRVIERSSCSTEHGAGGQDARRECMRDFWIVCLACAGCQSVTGFERADGLPTGSGGSASDSLAITSGIEADRLARIPQGLASEIPPPGRTGKK